MQINLRSTILLPSSYCKLLSKHWGMELGFFQIHRQVLGILKCNCKEKLSRLFYSKRYIGWYFYKKGFFYSIVKIMQFAKVAIEYYWQNWYKAVVV